MISFHDTPQDLSTSLSILHELEDTMAKCMRLDERMQIMNHSLAVDKSLIQKVRFIYNSYWLQFISILNHLILIIIKFTDYENSL